MNRSNQDTRQSVTISENVTMDSRKFLQILNNSAESQIVFFEEAVEKLGKEYGKNWQLHATTNGRIIIEDVDTNNYILADFSKDKGKVNISNLRNIEIMEGEKSPIFESACSALIEGLAVADHKVTESALSKLASCRFRSKVIPNSGMVRTKDGSIRKINTRPDVMSEEEISDLAQAITEDITDKVTINEGSISGSFNIEQLKLPVTELTNRRVIAYNAREQAKNAYWSNNFQTLVESIASAICKGEDAMKKMLEPTTKFLQEHQEFTLLSSVQMNEVVGNALAAKAVFNEALSEDTATFLYKTNLKTNKAEIIDAWKKTAKLVNHPVMMENVMLLESCDEKSFPSRCDEFLSTIFEDLTTSKGAALNGLQLLADKVTDPKLKEQVTAMLSKLQTNADDATVMEALSLLSKTKANTDSLQNFDNQSKVNDVLADPMQTPAEAVEKAAAAPTPAPAGTVININTGGGATTVDQPTAPAPAAAEPEVPDQPQSEDLLGALEDIDIPEAPKKEPQPAATPGLAAESTEAGEMAENDDFILPEGVIGGDINNDYGTPLLSEYILTQKVKDLDDLVKKNPNLKSEELERVIGDLAGTVLADDPSLKDAKKMDEAKKMLIGAYAQQRAQKNQEVATEDQYKSPVKAYRRRGLKRSSISRLAEGKFEVLKSENDAVLGRYKGIHFVIDRSDPPALLNADGSVEVVIPEGIVAGALYLTECSDTESDANSFVEWLDQNIEQLRPISEEEGQQIAEAVARISISPGDTLEVSADLNAPGTPADSSPIIDQEAPPLTPVDEPAGLPGSEGGEPVAGAGDDVGGEVGDDVNPDDISAADLPDFGGGSNEPVGEMGDLDDVPTDDVPTDDVPTDDVPAEPSDAPSSEAGEGEDKDKSENPFAKKDDEDKDEDDEDEDDELEESKDLKELEDALKQVIADSSSDNK